MVAFIGARRTTNRRGGMGLALTNLSRAPLRAGGGKDFRRRQTLPPETTILPG
jgi:hypothetical protein